MNRRIFNAALHRVGNQCGDSILPLQVALSDRTQILPFNYSSVRTGSALHSVGEPIDMYGGAFVPEFVQPVMSYRMDELIDTFRLQPPSHLKIDVDGAELLVLRGAERALSSPELRSLLVEVQLDSEMCALIVDHVTAKGFRLRGQGDSVTPGFANFEFGRG